MQLNPGTLLQGGKYKIEKALGQGGFGITYLAEQTNLNRKVCIKEFFMKEYGERKTAPAADDVATAIVDDATVLTGVSAVTSAAAEIMGRYKEKFIKEAKTIARLDHPGIVRIHDVFEENGTAYYVMDFIEGENLNDMVKREGPLSEDRALGYIRQIADALSYVHSHKIMHLDVKPANIIIRKSDDKAILIDFGTAKQYDSSGTQTSTTPVGLSAGYAPIELMKVGGVQTFSPETDVYSLGATLYYLVTGKNPPDASDVLDEGLPEMPKELSSSLCSAVLESMKTKKLRPKSISAFLELINGKNEQARIEAERKLAAEEKAKQEAEAKRQEQARTEAEQRRLAEEKSRKEADEKKNKLWLWALLGGIATAVIIVAIVLGGRRESQAFPPDRPSATTVSPTSSSTATVHEYVDLGLSVKWATCNIGAVKPEDYGSYFAWGETKPKDSYTWENYQFRTSGNSYDNVKFSKYNTDNSYGAVDNKKKLDLVDDAARAIWGGSWRMPTDEEMTELREKCKWEWTMLGGKYGYRVTSKTNGNSIFLPAAGYRDESGLDYEGSGGYYWSSSLTTYEPYRAWGVYFDSDEVNRSIGRRYLGFSVRPVTE